MSFSALRRKNRGAFTTPFSGVGVEYAPLGIAPDHSGIVLYEVGYLARNDWWNFSGIRSPFWRCYFNFKRGHRVIFPDGECELGPDRLVLIPDHQLFHTQGGTPVPHFWIHFNVARCLDPEQAVPIRLRLSSVERNLICQLRRMFEVKEKDAQRPLIFHHSLALLHLLLNRQEIRWDASPMPDGIRKVVVRINETYRQPLTIPSLARVAGIGLRKFRDVFKRYQGASPSLFVMQIRIREAAHLLTNTDRPLEAIAEETGFTNRHYLSRVFKKVTGESPVHFRKVHAGNKRES
jgi:AraC-like DNA-binding protein